MGIVLLANGIPIELCESSERDDGRATEHFKGVVIRANVSI